MRKSKAKTRKPKNLRYTGTKNIASAMLVDSRVKIIITQGARNV